MQTMRELFSRIAPFWLAFISVLPRSEEYTGAKPKPFPELVNLKRVFDSWGRSPDVLCLGDSVWERVSKEDDGQQTLGQMMIENLKGTFRVIHIAHSAYNLKVYSGMVCVLEKMRKRPQCVILSINLRSFSPQWYFNPLWQCSREIQALEAYSANPRMKIPVIEPVHETSELFEPFDATPVSYPASEFTSVGQFRALIASKPADESQRLFRLKQIFIFHYMHPLVPDHPLLLALDDLLRRLIHMGIGALVYVTPINYQAGLRLVGNDFPTALTSNVQMVSERVADYELGGQVCFLDYSTLLSSEHFFYLDNATEHLNQAGRKILAEQLAKVVASMFSKRDKCS